MDAAAELGRNPVSKHQIQPEYGDEQADEPVSRHQILRHARGQGNIHFPCSADYDQDWQPYPVYPYSAICDDRTYIHTYHVDGIFAFRQLPPEAVARIPFVFKPPLKNAYFTQRYKERRACSMLQQQSPVRVVSHENVTVIKHPIYIAQKF